MKQIIFWGVILFFSCSQVTFANELDAYSMDTSQSDSSQQDSTATSTLVTEIDQTTKNTEIPKETIGTTEGIESTEETETPHPRALKQERSMADGTKENPYLVSNEQEFANALKSPLIKGNSANHIELVSDIIYTTKITGTYLTDDVVVEGNNHTILSNVKSTSHTFLATRKVGLSATFKNLNFGNEEYTDSTYYGFFSIMAKNVNLTVENINYDIKNGAQPFYGDNSTGTTVTIKGKNYFKQDAKSDGGEFIEKINYIIFDEDSDTTVRQDAYSLSSNAVFWQPEDIYVKKNAKVDIETSMNYFTWSDKSTNLHIADNATFIYNPVKGKNYTKGMSYLNIEKMTVGDNARVLFKSAKDSFSYYNLAIDASSPDYILFEHQDSGTPAIKRDMNVIYNRKDNDNYSYMISSLNKRVQEDLYPIVTSNKNYDVTGRQSTNKESIVYARTPTIQQSQLMNQVGPSLSRLEASVTKWSVPTREESPQKFTYKFSDKRLYKGSSIESEMSQNEVEKAKKAQGVIEEVEKPIQGSQNKASLDQLAPKNYYSYIKLDDSRIPGYILKSPWVENMEEVPTYIHVTMPDKSLNFNSPSTGKFDKKQNIGSYRMINEGNIPIRLHVTNLKINEISDQKVILVDDIIKKTDGSGLLVLNLVARNTDTSETAEWGPMKAGQLTVPQTIGLKSYWQSGSQAETYVKGEYDGPMTGSKKVSYDISLKIKQD